MSRRVLIDPVTRIEGHARVTIELDDGGRVRDARVEVTSVRGFERFCVGRPIREMPALTARICGICPTAHALAAAMAGDAILGAEPPPTARKLRRLVHLAQIVQSHALAFFYLAAPELALPPDAPPERRSFLGLAEAAPELARDGILLRRFGQELTDLAGGRRIHAPFIVPGGVTRPLERAARDAARAALPAAISAAERTLAWWTRAAEEHASEAAATRLETPFLALVGAGGTLAFDGGTLRLASARGELLADGLDPAAFRALVAEEAVPWSRMTLPHWRALGPERGAYRVGPLARLRAASGCGSARADRARAELRALHDGAVLSTFHAHGARLVEILAALEGIEALLEDGELLGADVRAPAGTPRAEGVGACEAPRGTLFHAYRVDADGIVVSADLLIATAQNAIAMNRAVRAVAERRGADPPRDALRAGISAAIRAFDPCLSCATHAAGERWLALRVVGPGGEVMESDAIW